jgi:hypothetical protein
MNNYLRLGDMQEIVGQMQQKQHEHPKAIVLFDVERMRVEITYPLPERFYEVSTYPPQHAFDELARKYREEA